MCLLQAKRRTLKLEVVKGKSPAKPAQCAEQEDSAPVGERCRFVINKKSHNGLGIEVQVRIVSFVSR